MADLFSYAVEEMEQVGARFFSVYLETRRSMNILEVPPEFTASTGWPGSDDCGIVTSNNSIMEYPVKFDLSGVVAKSVGDGWANFLRHQKIRKGNFIVFEPADERCLAAMVYPPANTPEFTKTLRASHSSPYHSAKLDIPVSFWRQYGKEMFDYRYFTLRGPSASVTVSAMIKKTTKQTFVYLTHGWAEFRNKNSFLVGDTLVFTLISHANFQVVKIS